MLHYFSRLSQSRSSSARLLTLALLLAATACGSSLLPGERYVRKLLLSGVKNVEDDKLRDGLGGHLPQNERRSFSSRQNVSRS
jgi:hypothetical protein